MHINFEKIKIVGSKAVLVALLGTFTPILMGLAFMSMFGYDPYPEGFSVGSSLAPTSVGIALRLLTEGKYLHHNAGQTIVTAAFIDDVFSLVVLVILINLSSGSVTVWKLFSPALYSFLFLSGSVALALFVMPDGVKKLLSPFPFNPKAHFQLRDELHLIFMLISIGVFGKVGALIGSELLGTFAAGMLFCKVEHSMTVWHHQMSHFNEWLIRLFFCASVAFSVPVGKMFSAEGASLLWKGLLIALVPCVLAKVFSGVVLHFTSLRESKWTVGWAMVGRAEFAFLVAKVASESVLCGSDDGTGKPKMMLSEEGYIITLWALLVSIVLAPIMFKYVLAKEVARYRLENPANLDRMTVHIKHVELGHHTIRDIGELLDEKDLDIAEFRSDKDNNVEEFDVVVSERRPDLMDPVEIALVKASIIDAINEPAAKVHILHLHESDLESRRRGHSVTVAKRDSIAETATLRFTTRPSPQSAVRPMKNASQTASSPDSMKIEPIQPIEDGVEEEDAKA